MDLEITNTMKCAVIGLATIIAVRIWTYKITFLLHEERIYSKLYLAFIFYNVGAINKQKKHLSNYVAKR